MSNATRSASRNARSADDDKRRKLKERSAKSAAPEPKNIVSGAGQPLDLSVRRDLEEQLGHDFSQVRLHTGRDAGQLAELMGADAFAVGQDVFFREGTYRPGTADGRRLLAHELLHTVQNPHGLGALRAGRDLGAVSLPQEAAEREAESAAQESVRAAMLGATREDGTTPGVEPGHATPGWLRYATVDADRRRQELLDPATLVDRLAGGVLRSLRGDPEDRSKRARMQLAQLPDELRDSVLDRLERRLLSSEQERLLDLVAEIESDEGLEQNALDAPVVDPDPAEELRYAREEERRAADGQQEQEQKPGPAPGPEKDGQEAAGATGSTPRNGGTREDGTTPQGGNPPGGPIAGGRDAEPGGRQEQRSGGGGADPAAASGAPGAAPAHQAPESAPAAAGGQPADKAAGSAHPTDGKSADGTASGSAQQSDGKEGKKGAGADGKEGIEREGTPVAGKEESTAKNRPGAVDALVAGQQVKPQDKRGQEKPAGPPASARTETPQPGATSALDGVRAQDLDGPAVRVDEDPLGAGGESEVEVGGGEPSAWDVTLQPDDFLPAQDLDVSAVATADKLDPGSSGGSALPSFPAPPATRADKVQAQRDAEDAKDAAAEAEPEEDVEDASAGEPVEAPDAAGPDDGTDERVAPDRAAEALTAPGTASKNPTSGADPKAGPVAAQVTVAEAPGRPEGGGEAKEQAAKEEKGTPAAGGSSGSGQEKGGQQAAGGTSAAARSTGSGEQKQAGGAGERRQAAADKGASAGGDAQASSPGRDSQVAGGSHPDTAGGASADAAAGAQREPSGGGTASRTAEPGTQAGGEHGGAGGAAPTAAPQTAKAAPKASAGGAPAPGPAAAPAPAPAPAARQQRAPKATARSASAAKGGGGGSAATPAKKAKKDSGPTPNLSNVSPEAGLATASKLKPHRAYEAMGGVGGAVDRTVGDEHKALAAAPPSMQRPAGAPQTLQGRPKADSPAQYDQGPAQKSDVPDADKAEVTGAKKPEGQIEAEKAEEPGGWQTFKMALGFGIGWVAEKLGFKVDKQELAAKFAGLPTKDEALKQAQAGNAPGVQMQGTAGSTADEQGGAVDTKGQDTVATGRDDAGRPMGEDQVYPDVPKEQMSAKVPGAQGGKGGGQQGAANTGAVPPEAASEVAEHDRGPQFQAAFGDGQKGMSKGRQKKDQDFRDSQEKHKKQVDAEVDGNTKSQADERQKAMSEVTDHRSDWRKEQDQELKKLGDKKSERHAKVRKDVKDKEEKTDKDTTKEKEDGDKKIKDKGTEAEDDAKKKRDDSVNESGNWLSKAFDWIKQKVIEIKNAIVDVIKKARDAVVGFITHFKETVERWINEARRFIVDAIKNLINDLIEFAKAMVQAIVDLAQRIRKFITDLINAAIALVNKLATLLKKALTDLLNAIGKILSGILNILKQVLDEAIKQVKEAIKAVLDFASKLLSALGEWMLIAVDFLSDPGGWLSGAKNSAVDGAEHHLFREVSAAVKQWFKDKIQEIIGVPKATLEKLLKNGFKLDDIVSEAWNAVLPQLPMIIGELVTTKVVAKLIPGAGWVMAVIDAIRTAWGALSAILQALSMVLAWLRAVRSGGAGILFAKAVASGVVALLETLYQWLLNGIGKYVAKVGQRLKGVAAGLGKNPRGGDRGRAPGSQEPAREPAPRASGAPATRPAPTRPGHDEHPGERPGGGAPRPHDTRPGGRPNTPRPTERSGTTSPTHKPGETPKRPTPGNPKSPAGEPKKPTGTDKNGKPETRAGETPDTRPTPSPKPKPEPEPRPKPKPKPEPETKPKPKEDSPTKPKTDEKPSTKPKSDEHGPHKPKDEDPAKPKGKDDKDASGKPKEGDAPHAPKDKHPEHDPKNPKRKPDKEHDPKKGDHKKGDHKQTKHRPDRKSPHKPKHTKPNGKRPHDEKRDRKNKKKGEENSPTSKQARLNEIVARIRPILKRHLEPGMRDQELRILLSEMRAWYRLTSLTKTGGEEFGIQATLNPTRPVIGGFSQDLIDYLRKHQLPRPEVDPAPKNGVRPADVTKAKYINPKYADEHGQEPSQQYTEGWYYLTRYKLTPGVPQWDRMHLIPREVGGAAATSNFVPARNSDNAPFYHTIEKHAASAFGQNATNDPPIPGWYTASLKRYKGQSGITYPQGNVYPEGFPESLTVTWGMYKRRGTGTGENRADWMKEPAQMSATKNFDPPPAPSFVGPLTAPVNINTAPRGEVRRALDKSGAAYINATLRTRPFRDFADMRRKLAGFRSKSGKPLKDFEATMRRLKQRTIHGYFTF